MRLNHIGFNCLDLEQTQQFFIKYFNAQEVAKYHNPRTGLHSRMLLLPMGSTRFELMSWTDSKPTEHQGHSQGMAHLSLSVGSLDLVNTLTQRLESDGYRRLSGPRITGDGYYESCILGPENMEIEITV